MAYVDECQARKSALFTFSNNIFYERDAIVLSLCRVSSITVYRHTVTAYDKLLFAV